MMCENIFILQDKTFQEEIVTKNSLAIHTLKPLSWL